MIVTARHFILFYVFILYAIYCRRKTFISAAIRLPSEVKRYPCCYLLLPVYKMIVGVQSSPDNVSRRAFLKTKKNYSNLY